MAGSKARVVLDLNTRVKVIYANERDKLSVKQIMNMFNVGKTQVYEILKRKNDILRLWGNCSNGKIKREHKKTPNDDVNELVWEWYVNSRMQNNHISGTMIQEYAKQVAQKLGKTDFKASNGWLDSFRKRHQIVFNENSELNKLDSETIEQWQWIVNQRHQTVLNELCHQSNDVNSEAIEQWQWIAKLPFITEGYKPENIANGDESGLLFRALPNEPLCLKSEDCSGDSLCDERLTVFLCGFMSGEMEKPLVIGNVAKPQCFKNMDLQKLPIEWRSNRKSWMTSQIMKEWLTAFNTRMKKQKRHVLLFLDNVTCHPNIELSNVKLAWFPPNVLRPIDCGIIHKLKVHYRKLFLQSVLASMNSTSSVSEVARTTSVLDAIIWINQALRKLSPEIVTNCFAKAGFSVGGVTATAEKDNDLHELQNYMNKIDFSDCNAEDYINFDNDLQTEPDTMDVILDSLEKYKGNQKVKEEEISLEIEEKNYNEFEEQCRIKSYSDAIKSLKELQQFALNQSDSDMLSVISEAKIRVENQAANGIGKPD